MSLISPPKFRLDSDDTFAEIDTYPDGTRGRLAAHISAAQQHMFPRERSQKWAQNLRFLTEAPDPSLGYQYILTEDSIHSPEPYIAVSYCWRGTARSSAEKEFKKPRIFIPAKIRNGKDVVKELSARPEVATRAFNFARAKGIKKVWIDQESIDQDDRLDKESGIQSMDLVFRYAAITLAILDYHIQTEEDVLDLQTFQRNEISIAGPQRVDFYRQVLDDKWFTRSWTTQEFFTSTKVKFIVGWGEEAKDRWRQTMLLSIAFSSALDIRPDNPNPEFLDGKIDAQSVYGEWILTPRVLHLYINLARQSHPEPAYGISQIKAVTTYEDNRYRRANAKDSSSAPPFEIHASAASRIMFDKENSRPADRLAILGNFCNYRWRLNTLPVQDNGLSYVASVFALALYNGDTSLASSVVGKNDGLQPGSGAPDTWTQWLLPQEHTFQTYAKSALFTGASYESQQIKDCRSIFVLSSKLLVHGCIWELSPLDLSHLQPQMSVLVSKGLWFRGVKKEVYWECFKLIARTLIESGNIAICEGMLSADQMFDTQEELLQVLDEVEAWASGHGEYPEFHGNIHNNRWLFNAIADGSPLFTGRRVDSGQKPAALFLCRGTDDPKFVFTPSIRAKWISGPWPHFAFSWTISCVSDAISPHISTAAEELLSAGVGKDSDSTQKLSVLGKSWIITGRIKGFWSQLLLGATNGTYHLFQ